MTEMEPKAESPTSPRDAPPTPGADVRERLSDRDTYLVATVRPDARPRVVPVLAVWLKDALYFNARESTRKARNLDDNPHCVVAVGDDTFDLVIEGTAVVVSEPGALHRVASAFASKYPWWHPIVRDGVLSRRPG